MADRDATGELPGERTASTWMEHHPLLVDLAIGVLVVGSVLIFETVDAGESGASLDVVDVLCGLIAFVLIVTRRLAPVPVFCVALLAGMWSLVPADDQVVLRFAACLGLYTVAATSSRWVAWGCGALAAVALFVSAVLTGSGPMLGSDNLELVAWVFVATAAGDAVRSRRAYLVARQERIALIQAQAAQERDEEAQRRVLEERLRIARELHDVIAHNISVINLQAGVAAHLLRNDPDRAEEALGHVRRGAGTVLNEMADILRVMRQSDPAPLLDRLETLFADVRATGMQVTAEVTGSWDAVPATTQLAVYRIVQEAITNATRHGVDDMVEVRLVLEDRLVTIDVSNPIGGQAVDGGQRGHGIIGMQERANAAGGSLTVGADQQGQFRVHAEIPFEGGTQ